MRQTMRNILYWLGGRKFVAWFVAVATSGIGWYYGQISPADALIAIVTATGAYLTANVVDGAIEANKAKGGPE